MKKTLKMFSFLAAASIAGVVYGYAQANEPEGCCPGANFAARGCETQCVTVGGYISANYQYVKVRDHLHHRNFHRFADSRGRHGHGHHGRHHRHHRHHHHDRPDHFNNFYMKAIRMFIRGELCDGWSALMSVDFAGHDHVACHWNPHARKDRHVIGSHELHGRNHFFIDRAYIEKTFCNASLRFGYQKVNFGAEFLVPDECLKTINRSVATHYFLLLGHKASIGHDGRDQGRHRGRHHHHGDFRHGGNHFAGRHTGIYLAGDLGNFHYHAEVVNSYAHNRHHSTRFNNELGYFAGLAMNAEFGCLDLLFGIHAGYQPQGTRKNHIHTSRHNIRGRVWGFDPYLYANWNRLSLLSEFLWGHLDGGSLHHNHRRHHHRANPWGLNIIPSFMINDCWELVGRFSYLDTRHNGASIDRVFGVIPETNDFLGSNHDDSRGRRPFVASEVPFNKVASGSVGVNFFPLQSVKASLFYEYVRFRDVWNPHKKGDGRGRFHRGHATVNAVSAQLQLVF